MLNRLDPRFIALIKKQRGPLVLGLICSGLSSLLDLSSIAFIYWTIDAIERSDPQLLGLLCIGVVAIYGIKYFFTFGQTYFLSKAAQATTEDLRGQLFAKLHSLPISFFNRQRVGALQSVITNDVTVIQNGIAVIRDAITGPLLVVGGIGALFILSWKLTLVALLALPIVLMIIRRTARRVKAAQAEVQHELASMTSLMQESLASVRVVKSFNAENREVLRFRDQLRRNFDKNMALVKRIAALKPSTELVGATTLAATMFVGGWLISQGEMAIKDLLAFGFTLDKIKNGANGIGNLSNTYSQIVAAVERVYREVLDVKSDLPESKQNKTIENPSGRIEFRNVSFRYPDGTQALDNVSFTIEPGKSVALVGRSGAGKSTITDLILRFYDPTEGSITFDGIDLRDLDVNWLRQRIGVVPQQTLLFAASIKDNLAYGKPHATQEEIEKAARMSHASEFIENLPENYETKLGERGARLSGGEMQRVAIARALLVDPTLLILDEATSSLDPVSERKVQSALDEVMHSRTTLLIAHRLNTAARADKIVVLNRGQIVEMGSHDELVAKNGTYAGMFRAFSTGVFDGEL